MANGPCTIGYSNGFQNLLKKMFTIYSRLLKTKMTEKEKKELEEIKKEREEEEEEEVDDDFDIDWEV